MQECLDKYVQTEELKGYKCEKCSQETDATKQFGFSRLSSVLVVHLCRYTYDRSGQSSVKVSWLNTVCVCTAMPSTSVIAVADHQKEIAST